MNKTALGGIRILELSRFLPGGLATQMLGDLGADVIKIEQPGVGDLMRTFPPMGKQDSGTFLIGNRNKRSITLNLKSEMGKEVVGKLAARADVIVEGFRPGIADRLGMGYETLQEINPRLIYCSISGYGQSGPYRDVPGHDMNYLGITGMMQLIARPEIGPLVPGPLFADIGGGSMMAVFGILAAIVARQTTGKGQFIDVSMTDGAMHFMHSHASDYLLAGTEPAGGVQRVAGGSAAYNVYRCADDKHITLGIIEDHFWERLHKLVAHEDFPATPFPSPEETTKAKRVLNDFFATKPRDEWVKILWDLDIPAGPVNSLSEAFADPQMIAREMLLHVDHPVEGSLPQIGFPVKFSDTPGQITRPPPTLGQHTSEILTELGYPDNVIHNFREAGVT
ncbi:CaiB/BaiF CoA transferase family protein [Limoniibacter endophyticus]|uniref:CoA transferase n=1 Tax=Limoniibacter endophyticus TaxID=1565040 RepID=A0A8J3DL08_9HYPH|nr:CaiB/BaiF CoA-transferase family protein [Limoniibacter endophyticus]GHC78176.1 CoA transferase [Limoniibacter endophyticus]